MNRHELEALYTLNNPATSQAIKMLPPEWHILYPSYLQFLELSNGLLEMRYPFGSRGYPTKEY